MPICEACGYDVRRRTKCPDCGMMVCCDCGEPNYSLDGFLLFCNHGNADFTMPVKDILTLEERGRVKSNRICS